MSGLPKGWIGTTIGGLTNCNPKHNSTSDKSAYVSFVRMASVDEQTGQIASKEDRQLSDVWKGYTHLIEEDVLFAKITPCMENGKVAIASGLTNSMGCGSTEFHVLRSNGAVEAKLLWQYLRQADFRSRAERSMTGAVGQRRVPIEFIRSEPFSLPPAAEQHRIVAKIDRLSARSKRARDELDIIPKLVSRFKEAFLELAFRGQLTAAWRAERAALTPVTSRGASLIRPRYRVPTTFNAPYEVPEAWRWLCLPELGEFDRGRSRHRPRNDPALFGGDYFFIQTGEVRTAQRFIRGALHTYNETGLAQSRLWPIGTVCITIAANIAETAILAVEACFPDSVVGFVADRGRVSPAYTEFFMRTARADIAKFAPATAQKNINLEILGAVRVPLAPLEEQAEIVRRIEHAFAGIDRLAAEARSARALLDTLDQAILAKAFRGELVPQDPDDEPASVLLERIRAERAAAQPTPRGRHKA